MPSGNATPAEALKNTTFLETEDNAGQRGGAVAAGADGR